MAPIFHQEDIEALIRHFPPLSLSPSKPALIRTLSGNGLLDFNRITSTFESLLETSTSRIEILNIHQSLSIEKDASQLVLDQCSLQLYHSKDGRSLIPVPVADKLHRELTERARSSFVDLTAFATEQDISLPSIDRWIKFDAGAEWQTFDIDSKKFLCNQSLRGRIETRIREAIHSSGSDVCNVSANFDDEVQTPILKSLVEVLTKGQGGDVILDGVHVIYVPSEYSAAAEERYRQEQRDQVQLMAHELEDHRFSLIQLRTHGRDTPANGATLDLDELERAVRAKFEEWHPEGTQLRTLLPESESGSPSRKSAQDSPTRLLVDAGILHQELLRLKARAISLLEDDWSSSDNTPDPSTITQSLWATDRSPRPGLTQLLLRSSECTTELEQAARDRIEQLQAADRAKLIQSLEIRLLIPFQLHAQGISTIIDATLRQHLEEFIYEHFRREVIPATLKSLQEQRLLRSKSDGREVEKLRLAVVEAKLYAALQTSILKFSKKLKISPAGADATRTVQLKTLQQSLKAMKGMTRGSDVLQNLIWILLASKSGGLFMSSGKDTSRMIKQYEAVGDAEMASRLVSWKNKLKAGEEAKEDLEGMRELARLAVEDMAE